MHLPNIQWGACFRIYLFIFAVYLCLLMVLHLFHVFISVSYENSPAANSGVEWRQCSDTHPLHKYGAQTPFNQTFHHCCSTFRPLEQSLITLWMDHRMIAPNCSPEACQISPKTKTGSVSCANRNFSNNQKMLWHQWKLACRIILMLEPNTAIMQLVQRTECVYSGNNCTYIWQFR